MEKLIVPGVTETGRPIMALLDLIGRRWALRIVWELRNGPLRSRPLREACGGISPTIIQKRLNELREAKLVQLNPEAGYELTEIGRGMLDAFMPLHKFSEEWAAEL